MMKKALYMVFLFSIFTLCSYSEDIICKSHSVSNSLNGAALFLAGSVLTQAINDLCGNTYSKRGSVVTFVAALALLGIRKAVIRTTKNPTLSFLIAFNTDMVEAPLLTFLLWQGTHFALKSYKK